MTDTILPLFVAPNGEGKSVLDALLKLPGGQFIASPGHTDRPEDFAEAERAAHDLEACLPNRHNTVLEATAYSAVVHATLTAACR